MPADFTEFDAGGLHWRAEPAHADAVRREVAERLKELPSAPGVQTIKKNLVRAVYRVPLADGTRVIVKRYAVRGVRDWIKYRFVPSRALAEWTAGRGLAAAGVPTAVPIAMAERRDGALRDAALVVPEIPDALHLNAFIAKRIEGLADADELRRALFDQVVTIVRRMHAAGFLHRDLHGGNILVNGPPDAPSVFVIDLHSVRGPGAPSAAGKRDDMVKLLHSLTTCSSAGERFMLLLHWMDAPVCGPAADRLRGDLERDVAAMESRRVKSRTERALTRSSKFDVAEAAGFRLHRLREIADADVLAAIAAHRATLVKGGAVVLKNAKRSALTRQSMAGRPVVVKEYRVGGLADRLKNAFRRPRAVAAWVAGNGLLVRHFAAAEPIALALRGRGAALSEAFLVMEDLGEDARADLVVLARYAALDRQARQEKKELVLAAARLFRELHAGGVYHGDLKAVNLFVRETGKGPRIVLADYDRVEFDGPVSDRRRLKNLAQLSASVAVCVSLADRLRFFREYAADDPARAAAWKEWVRGVVHECRRKIVVRMKPIE